METENREYSTEDQEQKTELKAKKMPPIFAWKAPVAVNHERSRLWYVFFGTLSVCAIVYFILTDSASGALAVLMLVGVYMLTHNQDARIIEVEVNEMGIVIDKKMYPYSGIRFFWINYNPPLSNTLHIALVGKLSRIHTVQLGAQEPGELRNFLRSEIPEVEGRGDGFLEVLGKILKL